VNQITYFNLEIILLVTWTKNSNVFAINEQNLMFHPSISYLYSWQIFFSTIFSLRNHLFLSRRCNVGSPNSLRIRTHRYAHPITGLLIVSFHSTYQLVTQSKRFSRVTLPTKPTKIVFISCAPTQILFITLLVF